MRIVGAFTAAAFSAGLAGTRLMGGVAAASLLVAGAAVAQETPAAAPPPATVFAPSTGPAIVADPGPTTPLVAPQEAADTDTAVADAPDTPMPVAADDDDATAAAPAPAPDTAAVPGAAPAVPPVATLPAGITLEGALGLDAARLAGTEWSRADVERFYGIVGVSPLWTGSGRLVAVVPAVTRLLADAGAEGLDPRRYPLAQLDALKTDGANGAFEVLFTDTLIRYAADRSGARLATVRLPVDMRELGQPVDAVALAVGAVNQPDTAAALLALGPQDGEYLALKTLLADYRALAATGGWPAVPAGGAKIELNANDGRIPAIRARLAVTDGAAAEGGARPNHYDPALAEAVKHFQARHGLKADGVIGKLTLEHLSKPVEYRIEQILVNLERRRQQLDDLGPNRIIVNIPEFTLRFYEEGVLTLTTPVVLGRLERKTPLLQSRVTNVVLNPPWSVPAKLAGEDIVRKQINDPNYLTDHGFTVYADGQPVDPTTIDWTQVPRSRSIPYRLRQRPGAGNSLGRMKINFNNDYAVYLHDTPDKHLFARDMRALSSGCVRVKDPFDLGARLLRDVPGWDRARMDSTIERTTSTVFINVVHNIGVRLTYVTAWIDADGKAQFREDLYGIDARITKGLGRPVLLASDS